MEQQIISIDNLDDYPCIAQWVTYHGTITAIRIGDAVEVAIGDAGGITEDGYFRGRTLEEALDKANAAIPRWLQQTKALLDDLLSGELKDTEYEYLCVPGWTPAKNPFYVQPEQED